MTQHGLRRVRDVLAGGQHQIVVLDEICMAIYFKLVTLADILQLIDERPCGVELVLTGRRAPQELLDRADLVTEMLEVKHPYQRGIGARRGIEN
jgi:cob(I)alamin adenosyltransferase